MFVLMNGYGMDYLTASQLLTKPLEESSTPTTAVGELSENAVRALAEASKIQSLLFAKDKWTVKKAKKWAKDHGYKYGDVDKGSDDADYIHLRQADPEDFPRIRTITFSAKEGIKALAGFEGPPPKDVAEKITSREYTQSVYGADHPGWSGIDEPGFGLVPDVGKMWRSLKVHMVNVMKKLRLTKREREKLRKVYKDGQLKREIAKYDRLRRKVRKGKASPEEIERARGDFKNFFYDYGFDGWTGTRLVKAFTPFLVPDDA
jgi:hypothetical protein